MYCDNNYDYDYNDSETDLDYGRECRIFFDFDEYDFDVVVCVY